MEAAKELTRESGETAMVNAKEQRMKAIVYNEYGSPDVLRFEDIDVPAIDDDQVLVRVSAASPNPWDWHFMRGEPYIVRVISGITKPKGTTVLGSDMAGVVEAVGANVTVFQPGDDVFAFVADGGFAEYVAVDQDRLVSKPANLTFDQATAVPLAAATALEGLRDRGNIEPGQKVLINGASGGVGTFAVQIAKAFGAEVTAVTSTRNVDMVREIGADRVIDYTEEDVIGVEERFDLVMDNVGNYALSDWRQVMTPRGTFVSIAGLQPMGNWVGPFKTQLMIPLASWAGSQTMVNFTVTVDQEKLTYVKDLIETGKVSPVIDRTYALSAAPDAVRYLEEGHARGKVIVTI